MLSDRFRLDRLGRFVQVGEVKQGSLGLPLLQSQEHRWNTAGTPLGLEMGLDYPQTTGHSNRHNENDPMEFRGTQF